MSIEKNILPLIPQRPPFVMIDELLYADETLVRTAFQITEENILVDDRSFSEAGIIENIAQTAAAHAGYFASKNNQAVAVGYIGSVKNLHIFSLPKINNAIITEVKIENQIFDVTIVAGKVFCNDKLMAECEMKIFLQSSNSNNN